MTGPSHAPLAIRPLIRGDLGQRALGLFANVEGQSNSQELLQTPLKSSPLRLSGRSYPQHHERVMSKSDLRERKFQEVIERPVGYSAKRAYC
jgi:hypothetical protein